MGKVFLKSQQNLFEVIIQYLKVENKRAIFITSPWIYIFHIFRHGMDEVLIVSNHMQRKFAKIFGISAIHVNDIRLLAQQYVSLCETFRALNKKGVPCYMFNRVAKINDFNYTPSAVKRMEKQLSFPKMFENIEANEADFKELIGDSYSVEYVKQLGELTQIVKKGSTYCHEDLKSNLVNIIGGRRVVVNCPEKSDIIIHMYGRCGVFGYAVEDKDSLPSLLQKKLIEDGYNNISVINHGLWGGDDNCINHNLIFDAQTMKKGDVVIIYMKHYQTPVLEKYKDYGLQFFDITQEYHQHEKSDGCFYDRPGHMNKDGYNIVASIICEKIIQSNMECKTINNESYNSTNSKYLKEYLNTELDCTFQRDLKQYLAEIEINYPVNNQIRSCGSIVMNCNPFTKGHRFLIEYAATRVDRLYIFVVEEDKSYFKFADRLEMVKKGTSDLDNVIVLPSGKFIISALTFPEYFMKDYVKEKDFDVSMDLETFCKSIAPSLNISVRFAGEEPFDPVTLNYNINMRKILPQFGLEFVEIPRLEIDGIGVISATKVRAHMKEKNLEEIKKYVPQTTYDILTSKYME